MSQYKDTQANLTSSVPANIVGGLSKLQLVRLDYPTVRGAQYLLNDDFDSTLEAALVNANLNLPVVQSQLEEQSELIEGMLTELRVLSELIHSGLNIHDDLDHIREDAHYDMEDNEVI